MRKHHLGIDQRLWTLLDEPKSDPENRFRAACALASAGATAVENRWDSVSSFITGQFLTAVIRNPGDYATLIETLRRVRKQLLAPLSSIFRDTERSETERNFATIILADDASDDPDAQPELLMSSGHKAYVSLLPAVQRQSARDLPAFEAEIARDPVTGDDGPSSEERKDSLAERQARAAVAFVRLGRADLVWPLLHHSPDPRLPSFIVNWLNPLGADPKTVTAKFARLQSPRRPREPAEVDGRPGEGSSARPATQKIGDVLFHLETSTRRALILAVGTYSSGGLSPGAHEPLIVKLLDLYRDDPDGRVHGASEWAFRQWKQRDELKAADAELCQLNDRGQRHWYLSGQGQTFVLVEGPVEFRMGSSPIEPERESDETAHRRLIPRRIAFAAKKVSVEMYERFTREYPQFGLVWSFLARNSPNPDGPMIAVNWFGAVAYCNWLSKEEGLPPDHWCYQPNEKQE